MMTSPLVRTAQYFPGGSTPDHRATTMSLSPALTTHQMTDSSDRQKHIAFSGPPCHEKGLIFLQTLIFLAAGRIHW